MGREVFIEKVRVQMAVHRAVADLLMGRPKCSKKDNRPEGTLGGRGEDPTPVYGEDDHTLFSPGDDTAWVSSFLSSPF